MKAEPNAGRPKRTRKVSVTRKNEKVRAPGGGEGQRTRLLAPREAPALIVSPRPSQGPCFHHKDPASITRTLLPRAPWCSLWVAGAAVSGIPTARPLWPATALPPRLLRELESEADR